MQPRLLELEAQKWAAAARAEGERQAALFAECQTALCELKEAAENKVAEQHRQQKEQQLAKLREAETERSALKDEVAEVRRQLEVAVAD